MNPAPDGIDPTWWACAFETEDHTEFESPLRLSVEFNRMLEEQGLSGLQRKVIEVLAAVTSPMLKPGDWLTPFTPAMQFGNRRSIVPSDLDPDQLAMLACLAPLIEQPSLRARVADIAWFYGDRSNVAMLDIAIDAYRAAPLTEPAWISGGKAAWQRAFELVKRRSSNGSDRVDEMTAALVAAVLGARITDRFFAPDCAAMLRENARLDSPTVTAVAKHLVALAAHEEAEPRLSRHLEREAAAWFRASDSDSKHACIERVARTYIAEADLRLDSDPDSGALVESHSLEKAIETFRTLPRRYRAEHGIEELIAGLRERLDNSREATLEAMMRFESDPVELTDATSYARSKVSGKSSAWEALATFAILMPPMDAEKTRASAQERIEGSISHLFSSSTYARDGRKVAARLGSTGQPDDSVVWAEVVRTVAFQAQLVSTGVVLPAQQVITTEHLYTRDFLARVCAESPVVPEGHAQLWAAGLAFGLSGDYGSAVAILVPQLEHLVRVMLKGAGAHTLLTVENGVETEKSLAALLDMPQAAEVLGAGIVMELKAMLVDPGAANLRHDIAHGLLDDAAAWSHNAVYMWWSCLRLVVWPLWKMINQAAVDPAPGEQTGTGSDTPSQL